MLKSPSSISNRFLDKIRKKRPLFRCWNHEISVFIEFPMHHSYLGKHFYLPKNATKYPSEQTQISRVILAQMDVVFSFLFFFFSVLFLPVVYLSAIFTHLMIGKCACASNPNRCAPIHRPFIHRAYLWYWRKVRSWTDPLRIGGSSCNPSAVIKAPHGAIKWAAIAYRKLHYARYSPLHCTACNSIKSKVKWLFSIAINATLIG